MKKVLFTATVDVHIKSFHIPYLKLFKEKGYEVHVATNGDEDIPYCDVKHKVSFERSPFKINNVKAIKELRKIIEEEKFDIIHCHTPMGSVVTRIAAKNARKCYGTRVIYTAHGFHFYKGAPLLNWIMFYPVEKYLSKFTDDLILINYEDYDLAIKKFHAKKTHLVHGVGVDPEKFSFEMTEGEKDSLRKEIGISKDDIVLIYVAELNKNKNQKMAIDAMQELVKENPKYKLLLVGKDSYNGKYQQMVKKLNLEDNIKFLGYRKDVPKLMKISNIAISTSLREGLPVNLIESSMCGLPIVATDCRGNRDVVNECKNGKIVGIDSIFDFKKNIINISKSFNDLKYNEYTLKNCINKMNNIYFQNSESIKRILHVIGSMNMGGAENFIMNLYRNIDRNKYQFDFISHDEGIFDNEIKKLGGRIYYLKYINKIGPLKYKKQLSDFFKKHCEYEIMHTHVDQTSGIVLDVARKYNFKKLIAHSHSTSNSNNIIVKLYKNILQKKIIKYSTNKLACTEDSAKWLYKNNKSEIINNGIDIDKYRFNNIYRDNIRDELNIPKEAIIIGHVGRFNEVKNHKMIIDIFINYHKNHFNSFLLLVGDGPLRENIQRDLENNEIKKYIKFLGIREDTNKIYSAMDIFIFPSFYEGFPVTLIEASINGLPILASDTITKQVNINGNVKFLKIKDINLWVENLNNLNRINIDNKCIKDYDIKNIVLDYYKIIGVDTND